MNGDLLCHGISAHIRGPPDFMDENPRSRGMGVRCVVKGFARSAGLYYYIYRLDRSARKKYPNNSTISSPLDSD